MATGTIHDKKAMFLHIHVGTAENDEEGAFGLAVGAGDHTPIITSKRTGKTWTASWPNLIGLAIEAGILVEGDGAAPMGDAERVRILREALKKAHEALDGAKGNINPERGFCDETEAEIRSAMDAAEIALEATKEGA